MNSKSRRVLGAILSVSALTLTSLALTMPAKAETVDTGSHFVSEAVSNPYTGEQPGWHTDNFGKFYVDGSGNRLNNGLRTIDGQLYYFQPWGYCAQNEWVKDKGSGRWCYAGGNCILYHGGLTDIGGNRYFFEGNGWAATGWKDLGGVWNYFMPSSAQALYNCWAWVDNAWYGFGQYGDKYRMCVGWVEDGSYQSWYYCESSGRMVTNCWKQIDGKWYGFEWDGKMSKNWVWDSSYNCWFYCGSDGVMRTGWQQIDGPWYYFTEPGYPGYSQSGWVTGTMVYNDWAPRSNGAFWDLVCWIQANGVWDGTYWS